MNTPIQLSSLGMICASGSTPKKIWNNIFHHASPSLTRSDECIPDSTVPVGQVETDLPPVPSEFSDMESRNLQLTIAALEQIQPDLSPILDKHGPDRIGVVVGTSTSGISEAEKAFEEYHKNGQLPDSFHYSKMEIGVLSSFICDYLGISGPSYTISTSCSSSAKVFASAQTLLRNNWCDAVVVGGSDSLCKLTVNGFNALQLLSQDVSLPMSKNRSGINIGEGAAFFLMVQSDEGIQLEGVGESSDAHGMNAPDPSGKGAQKCMRSALEKNGLGPNEVDYINLHGTATQKNDAMESQAINRTFGDSTPCSSTKPFFGHTLGAAGALEAGLCWLMLDNMKRKHLPLLPHFWDGVLDEDIPELSLVRNPRHHVSVKTPSVHLLSNSFAFGGHNCSVLLGKELNG